jgi:arsenate reductase-like glutaredoxin family protein
VTDTLGDVMAAQIVELKAELKSTRRRLVRAEQSRDDWKQRYEWAALAARKQRAKLTILVGPKQIRAGSSPDRWKRWAA